MPPKIIQTAAIVGNDWVEGQYYDDAERSMEVQWTHLIWPIIAGSDFSTTLELAPGHGRNTAKLLEHATRLYAVDINQTNIDFLNQRFKGVDKLAAIRNAGADLEAIGSASITFVYCFDAMVHFDSDVVRSYIREFRRVMKPGAHAFIHYSAYDKDPTGSYRDHPGWRNFMSPALFHHWLAKEGFKVLRSAYVTGNIEPGDKPENADAITLFELPRDAQPMVAQSPHEEEAATPELRERLREMETLLAKRELQRRSMEKSASWRLTAPLRWIRDAFGK